MEHIYHEEQYKNYTLKIYQDESPMNPREWDNLGTMTCFHSGYNLGDEQERDATQWLESMTGLDDEQLCKLDSRHSSLKDYHDALIDIIKKDYVILPLYLYDHSGITMNTTGFSCRWDSGQVGFIYVSKTDIRKEYNVKRISPKLLNQVEKCLIGEVKTYDQYLTGDVYGYVIGNDDDDNIDSCWGYHDDYKYQYTIADAKSAIDYIVKNDREKHFTRLKTWIKNRVPLQVRQELIMAF